MITRDRKPWMFVEAKIDETGLSPQLHEFQKTLKTEYAFRVVLSLPYAGGLFLLPHACGGSRQDLPQPAHLATRFTFLEADATRLVGSRHMPEPLPGEDRHAPGRPHRPRIGRRDREAVE